MKNAQSANDKPAHDIEDLNRAVARELKRLQSKAPASASHERMPCRYLACVERASAGV